MPDFPSEPLGLSTDLRMGETIIAADCSGDGFPIFSADTGDKPWNYSSHCRVRNRRGSLVVGARGSIGHPRLPDFDEFAATQTTIVVEPDTSKWESKYLFYALSFIRFDELTAQQAVPMLTVKELSRITVPRPERPRQQRIAEILSTVDEAIEQTEALIAKTQQIKAGLMHDLFTRGVTPDGQLRPSRDEVPHLYQESPLGCISKEWNVELLDKVATRKSGHTPSQSVPGYWNGGIKWLSLADSWRLDQVYVTETEKNISQAGLENSSAVMLPTGTVVLSRDGSRLGKSSILGSGMAVSQHFMAWICGEGLDKDYLYWWLQYRRWEFENVATGSTIPTIGLQFFKRYTIRLPREIGEQKMIGQLLLSVHHQVLALEQSRESMVQIKSGLMHDLLTGHVRVPISAERTKAGR